MSLSYVPLLSERKIYDNFFKKNEITLDPRLDKFSVQKSKKRFFLARKLALSELLILPIRNTQNKFDPLRQNFSPDLALESVNFGRKKPIVI